MSTADWRLPARAAALVSFALLLSCALTAAPAAAEDMMMGPGVMRMIGVGTQYMLQQQQNNGSSGNRVGGFGDHSGGNACG